jgi:hypothetical protein
MAKRCSYVQNKKGAGFKVGRTGGQVSSGPANPNQPPAKHSIGDWVTAIRYNAMLSGPRTLMVNIASGATELPYKLLRDGVSQHPELTVFEVMGGFKAIDDAWNGAWKTLRHGVDQQRAQAMGIPIYKQPGGFALNAPSRIGGAVDEFVHQLAYGMELGRQGAIHARNAGVKGLKNRATLVDDLIDTPTETMTSAALDAANRLTFKGDMGEAGEAFHKSMQALGPIGNIIAPFVRTPYHITARGLDRSPIGLVATLFDAAMEGAGNPTVFGKRLGASAANPPTRERLADGIIGTALTGWAFSQAMQGNISGSGPEDSNERAALERRGWLPNAIKVNDRWVSYQQIGAWAVPLAAAGAVADTLRYKTGKNEPAEKDVMTQLTEVARRFGESWTENGYLSGLGDLAAVLEGKGAGAAERFAAGTAVSFVPFSAAARSVAQAQDPSARAPEGIGERLLQNVPQLPGPAEALPDRQSVPPALDVYGREKPNTYSGFSAVVPARQQLMRPDPVDQELDRVGKSIGPTPKNIAGQELTRQQASDYQRMGGANTYAGLQALMSDPEYRSESVAQQNRLIDAVVREARERAGELVLAPEDRPIKETGLPPKYEGITTVGEEKRIDAIIDKVNEYRTKSRKDFNLTDPEPTDQEWDIYGTYRSAITDEYKEELKKRARQSEDARGAAMPFDARTK